MKEVYELARVRAPKNKMDNAKFREYEIFYDLNIQKRAMLYLKDVIGMKVEDIQEVFVMQRHQVLELLHNSYYGLVKDVSFFQESKLEQEGP